MDPGGAVSQETGARFYGIARLPLQIICLDEALGWVYKRAVILYRTISAYYLE
jgi:hypothetical protein